MLKGKVCEFGICVGISVLRKRLRYVKATLLLRPHVRRANNHALLAWLRALRPGLPQKIAFRRTSPPPPRLRDDSFRIIFKFKRPKMGSFPAGIRTKLKRNLWSVRRGRNHSSNVLLNSIFLLRSGWDVIQDRWGRKMPKDNRRTFITLLLTADLLRWYRTVSIADIGRFVYPPPTNPRGEKEKFSAVNLDVNKTSNPPLWCRVNILKGTELETNSFDKPFPIYYLLHI